MRAFSRIARSAPRWTTLIVVVLGVLTAELIVAWNTYGTADVLIFSSFARTIREVGPVRIYALGSPGLNVYNHPPLVGWWLEIVNAGTDLGLPFSFMIRLPSALAHAATVLVVYAILRRRVRPAIALVSALLVALSPVLAIISGFHGNNDPVVALFTILAVFLLVDRRAPVWAGFAFSVAVSVKLVPVIALPLLAVAAWRLGRWRELIRFAAGGLPVLLLTWLPVLTRAAPGFVEKVIAYNGYAFPRVWGVYGLLDAMHVPRGVLDFYAGPGSYLVLAVSAAVPALLLVRNDLTRTPAALGLAFSLFLTLSPAWAPQYLAWIGATVFLIEFWSAVAFTVVVGGVYVYFYSYWNGFKAWSTGNVAAPTAAQEPLLLVAWIATAITAIVGGLVLRRRDRAAAPVADPPVRALGAESQPEAGLSAGSGSSSREIR